MPHIYDCTSLNAMHHRMARGEPMTDPSMTYGWISNNGDTNVCLDATGSRSLYLFEAYKFIIIFSLKPTHLITLTSWRWPRPGSSLVCLHPFFIYTDLTNNLTLRKMSRGVSIHTSQVSNAFSRYYFICHHDNESM